MTESPENFSQYSKNNESLKQVADEPVQKVVGMVSNFVNILTIVACLVVIGWFIFNR
jgi:hypothetical protein